jgi:alkaline phosphatase D
MSEHAASKPRLNRRLFLVTGLAAGGVLAAPRLAGASPAPSRPRVAARDPFGLGVASGDPRPDGMVLWTRLAPQPLDPDGGMGSREVAVEWELATDEAFGDVVASGTETAVPDEGHSVHAEPGGVQAGAEYFYRFRADGYISPVGRTRSAPAPGTDPGSVTFAVGSCQHYETGWYHAHRFIAEDAPDLVLFLGDYMYEKPAGATAPVVRGYIDRDEGDSRGEYRLRYAQHHLDPNLKAAHAVAPWVPVFDDHELANNWWGNGSDWPAARKQDSFEAFWENMPLPKSLKPSSSAIPLYRRAGWGSLATFHMLDTRQYRWKQADEGDCDEMERTDRTLTGPAQEQWLLDGLAEGGARWDFLGQQVFFAMRDGDGDAGTCDTSPDAWDGYRSSRDRITQGWIDRAVRNPVVLTGDVHRGWAASLRTDYFDHDSPYVGSELVATSVTSPGSETPPDLSNSPHLHYVGNQRGYIRASVTNEQVTAEFMAVSDVLEPNPDNVTVSVAKTFAVRDGVPGVEEV